MRNFHMKREESCNAPNQLSTLRIDCLSRRAYALPVQARKFLRESSVQGLQAQNDVSRYLAAEVELGSSLIYVRKTVGLSGCICPSWPGGIVGSLFFLVSRGVRFAVRTFKFVMGFHRNTTLRGLMRSNVDILGRRAH